MNRTLSWPVLIAATMLLLSCVSNRTDDPVEHRRRADLIGTAYASPPGGFTPIQVVVLPKPSSEAVAPTAAERDLTAAAARIASQIGVNSRWFAPVEVRGNGHATVQHELIVRTSVPEFDKKEVKRSSFHVPVKLNGQDVTWVDNVDRASIDCTVDIILLEVRDGVAVMIASGTATERCPLSSVETGFAVGAGSAGHSITPPSREQAITRVKNQATLRIAVDGAMRQLIEQLAARDGSSAEASSGPESGLGS